MEKERPLFNSLWIAAALAASFAFLPARAGADEPCRENQPRGVQYTPVYGFPVETNGFEQPHVDPDCVMSLSAVDEAVRSTIERWTSTGQYTSGDVLAKLRRINIIIVNKELIEFAPNQWASGLTDARTASNGDRFSASITVAIRDQYQGSTLGIFCRGRVLIHEMDHHLAWVYRLPYYNSVGHQHDIWGNFYPNTTDLANGIPTYGDYCAAAANHRVNHWGMAGDEPIAGRFFTHNSTRDDIGVYRPADSTYYLLEPRDDAQPNIKIFSWGFNTDKRVMGDVMNKNDTQLGVFRNGEWYFYDPVDGEIRATSWGLPGDLPLVGNFLPDVAGDEIAVFRSGVYYITSLNSSTPVVRMVTAGGQGDHVGAGRFVDTAGEAHDQMALWNSQTGIWRITDAVSGQTSPEVSWGRSGDIFLPKRSSTGLDQLGVFRSDAGGGQSAFFFIDANGSGSIQVPWGLPGDKPLLVNLEGQGKKPAVVRENPSGPNTWWFLRWY